MSMFIDMEFINKVSPQLDQFKRAGKVYNCRCPICGYSTSDKLKARGYFIENNEADIMVYVCHRCGAKHNIGGFLDVIGETGLKRDWIIAKFRDNSSTDESESLFGGITLRNIKEPTEVAPEPAQNVFNIEDFPTLDTLSANHPAIIYAQSRSLPTSAYYILRWCDDIGKVGSKLDGYSDRYLGHMKCILFPFYSQDGKELNYIQCRNIDKNDSFRFMTFKLNEDEPKLFGLDRIDPTYPTIIVEGIIDSMMVYNGVAAAGSDIPHDVPNSILVWDNEPNAHPIVKKMAKAIDDGCRVLIWDDKNTYNDIDDMLQAGYLTMDNVYQYIMDHSYTGLKLKLEYTRWKNVL